MRKISLTLVPALVLVLSAQGCGSHKSGDSDGTSPTAPPPVVSNDDNGDQPADKKADPAAKPATPAGTAPAEVNPKTTPVATAPAVTPVPASVPAIDDLAGLKSDYCTITLKNDLKDNWGDVGPKAGETYLFANDLMSDSVYFSVEHGFDTAEFTSADVASSTCDYAQATWMSAKHVLARPVTIYASSELSGSPACTLSASDIGNNYSYAWNGKVGTLQADSMTALCGGIDHGYTSSDFDVLALMPKA